MFSQTFTLNFIHIHMNGGNIWMETIKNESHSNRLLKKNSLQLNSNTVITIKMLNWLYFLVILYHLYSAVYMFFFQYGIYLVKHYFLLFTKFHSYFIFAQTKETPSFILQVNNIFRIQIISGI